METPASSINMPPLHLRQDDDVIAHLQPYIPQHLLLYLTANRRMITDRPCPSIFYNQEWTFYCGCTRWSIVDVPGGALWMYQVEHCGCTRWSIADVPGGALRMYQVEHCGCTRWSIADVPGGALWMYQVEHCGCTRWSIVSQCCG
ncbi:hypothetical protein UPYG_G00003030 [Umbra pygmaea]|uniref:Uncharacterized protein n=1 Tax=Umbra pygmaea TaxID=75934 RepID=A0ABD0Y133_UMBPY